MPMRSEAEREYTEYLRARLPRLHRAAYLLCGDAHLAEDLVQSTALAVFRKWRRVQAADNVDAYVLGPGVPQAAIAAAAGPAEMVRVAEGFLHTVLPPRDPTAEQVADIVARIAGEPELTRVDDLAEREGTSLRRLQRLFSEYVGIGPKRVIRRYRLREVTERMASGAAIDWGRLAAELGYADQAHLARDFTAIVGESPTRYAARYPA